MKVLLVGSEATPFSKTGGLADVLGALPKELLSLGVEAKVVLPKHMWTKEKFNKVLEPVCNYRVTVGPKEEYAGIEQTVLDGVTFYFVDNEYYFGYRNSLYGHYDDGERYGFYCNAVLKMLEELDYFPDIIHCNDWQTGLIPYLYKMKYKNNPKYKGIKTILTIHNIAYQGRFSKDLMPYLDVDYSNDLEFDNVINFLKTGIQTSDFVTTVSENYANEILFDYFGYGMQNILRDRQDKLFGIVNGIDYTNFNPKLDKKIFKNYGLHNYLKGKSENKESLREYYDLERNDLPMIGVVSRLTEAKGFDLIMDIIEPLVANNEIQLVLLGSGDPDIENYFKNLRDRHPNQIGVYIGYSDEMARKIYAGVDMFLMPSRFEPCGLAQLISLKYGTVPIVRKTGGLRDTIEIYNKFTGEGTGFGFENYDSGDLLYSINNALEVYADVPSWKKIVRTGMQKDFSWQESAKKYIDLYTKLKGE